MKQSATKTKNSILQD